MEDRFICSICGEEHAGLVTDWAYTLPDEVWAIPEAERADKARFNNDLCQFNDRNFIRCVLEVPFTEDAGYFGWGAWAEVDWPTFERYLELYDVDGNSEPTHIGTLANELPAYPGSIGTPVVIQFREPTKRPSLYVNPENQEKIAFEQHNGINDARYHEILGIIGQR